MRITILTLGTHGDIQPFVALGMGLRRAGHTVRLAARDNFRDFVTTHGLEFVSLGKDPSSEASAGRERKDFIASLASAAASAARIAGSFVPGLSAPIWPEKMPWLDELVQLSWQACQGADAVISGILFFWVNSFAEKLNVPWFIGLLQPCTPTRSFPNLFFTALFPSGINLGGGLNMMTHRIAERLFFAASLRLINRARRDVLGMQPLPNTRALSQFYNRQAVVLCAYSPVLSPKPPDWPAWHHVTGYWFLDQASNWSPPPDLLDFLSSGPPPVYVGFGSFKEKDPKRLTSIVVESLARTKQRGILLTGWGGLTPAGLPDTIFPIATAPHDWLFPRMSVIVHHGGAGTTGAALRAGIPAVAIPWHSDHPFFANCAYAIGASARPIPKKNLSVDRLTQAIDTALTDPRIRERALNASRQMADEDGVGRAIALIQRKMGS